MAGIFKAYDIRGAYPDELNEETAQKIGAAFIRYLRAGHIVVGQDMRLSSPALAKAFIEGALSQGADVTDIGMVTTPLLYFAVIEGKFEGGAMLTASHLPARMNGIKLCREQAVPLSMDQGLPELNKMVAEGMPAGAGKRGKCRTMLFLDRYVEEISRFVQQPGPLRIAVDAGNGSIGPELSRFFPGYPMWKIDSFYTKPDGSFPHHVANPLLPENTKDLQKRVLLDKADIGVAFDGDADRCGFIDERGRRIREDLVTAFVAEFYLSQKPGERIVYDLRSSRIVPNDLPLRRGSRQEQGRTFLHEGKNAPGRCRLCGRTFGALLLQGHRFHR